LSVPIGDGDAEGVGVGVGIAVADAVGVVVGSALSVALAVGDGVVLTEGATGPEAVPLQAVTAPSESARPSHARRKE
jgi:hypothetical protein